MLNKNYLLDKLRSGKPALGTWNVINSPMIIDVIASSGLDFVIIDAEHGCTSFETAQIMVAVCESHGVSPVMRVGEINESMILRALDIGIHGLQLPNISRKEDAENFVKFAKYPPIGCRGFSPFTKAGNYDFKNAQILTEKANGNTLLIANVEGVEGLNNLEAISNVDGLDVIFIGLFDLSKSLGIAGDVNNPIVIQKLEDSVKMIHTSGKKVGTIAANAEKLRQFKAIGVDYLTYSVDTGILKEAYQNIASIFNG